MFLPTPCRIGRTLPRDRFAIHSSQGTPGARYRNCLFSATNTPGTTSGVPKSANGYEADNRRKRSLHLAVIRIRRFVTYFAFGNVASFSARSRQRSRHHEVSRRAHLVVGLSLQFDLQRSSRSMRVFRKYLERRGIISRRCDRLRER